MKGFVHAGDEGVKMLILVYAFKYGRADKVSWVTWVRAVPVTRDIVGADD